MHIDLSLGEKIKQGREDKRITQHELARCLGISPAAVCLWERKGTVPRPKTLAKVAQALGVPADYLIDSAASRQVLGSVSAEIDRLKAKIAEATGVEASLVHVNITIAD